jgi:predicted PurR-regulated permease PerM
MISARLPRLRELWEREPLRGFRDKYLPAVRRLRTSLGAWFRAQLKLMLVCWGIVGAGFLFLGIRRGLLWAALVALVDAVPLLGTGLVLLPWALVSFLQQSRLRAIGLLCIWGAAVTVRTVLEPRLVGRQLGLDSLLTLAALYIGYRFWGLTGMLLAPLFASVIKTAIKPEAGNRDEKN